MSIEANPVGVACNLSCPYCYEDPLRDAGNINPGYDFEAMKKGLERENWQFTLFGGEPLLLPLPQLEEVFAWGLQRFGCNGIQTNGTLITETHVQLFKKYKVGVGLSMDGPGALNDSRWAGTLEKTRAATLRSEWALHRLLELKMNPSLIVTLYRGNAVGESLGVLKRWLAYLDGDGMKHVRLHLLEVEDPDVRARMALTDDENVHALREMMAFQDQLKNVRFDLFADMAKLLIGTDGEGVSCIWNACDPYTTAAVRGVNGVGDDVNCGRTNKDGVDFGKANVAGYERQLILHDTPQEDNGCAGCRFFFACKGQCPGTAVDGDWRNRSEQCQVWFRTFESIERQLVGAGKVPLSLSPMLPKIEGALLESWGAGHNMSVTQAVVVARGGPAPMTGNQEHGDHWDAPDGYAHDDAGFTVHGDHGVTETHGDTPHGDSDES